MTRRFYTEVTVEPAGDGHAVLLDARPVRTPGRAVLALPTVTLAHAIADEWAGQGETVDPGSMPLTRLANTVLDGILASPGPVADAIANYAGSDLLCHRADWPADLAARQAATWDPLIDWANRRFDIALTVGAGVMPIAQPQEVHARLSAAVHALDPWTLAATHMATTVTGSLILGLMLADGAIDPERAWAAGQLDDLYQAEQWGEDPEAAKARAARRADLDTAARMLRLLAVEHAPLSA